MNKVKFLLLFLLLISNKVCAETLFFEETKEIVPDEYCLKVLNMGKFIGDFNIPHSNPNKVRIGHKFIFNNELIFVRFRIKKKREGIIKRRLQIYASCSRYKNVFEKNN